MALNIADILSTIQSHASNTGYFEQVTLHEPKSAPGHGICAAVFFDRMRPAGAESGLGITTGVLTFIVRVYGSMLAEPQDDIDMNMIEAVDAIYSEYSGDFTLGNEARNVDLLGQTGVMMDARAGYAQIDNKIYRVIDITIPVIVDNLWTQTP